MDTKPCSQCGQEKELSGFYKRKDRKSGYASACKTCHSKYERQVDKEAQSIRARKSWLKIKYNMTLEDYDRLSAAQEHRCAICGSVKDDAILGGAGFFHVDHNHETGKVRGLLCLSCNTLLGKAMDSPTILRAAVQYLEDKGYYG